MNPNESLNNEVYSAIIKIKQEHPELLKYLEEIPEHFTTEQEKGMSQKELEDYLDSLKDILKNYSK